MCKICRPLLAGGRRIMISTSTALRMLLLLSALCCIASAEIVEGPAQQQRRQPHNEPISLVVNTGNGNGAPDSARTHPLRKTVLWRRKTKQAKTNNRITIDFGTQSTSGKPLPFRSTPPSISCPEINAVSDDLSDTSGQITQNPTSQNINRITYNEGKRGWFRRRFRPSSMPAVTDEFNANTRFDDGGEVVVSIDIDGAKGLLALLPAAVSTIIGGLVSTLRIVFLLIAGRRLLNAFVYFINDIVLNFPIDYLTGYYLRKTFTRLERAYLRYYELPSALRALARTVSQMFTLFLLSGIVGWVYGISEPPCREEGSGLSMFCGILWMTIVVAAGRACSSAVAVWGGPLRVEVASHPKNKARFTRPSHFVEWVTNMDELKSILSHDTVKAFDPNPLIFPATWIPLKILVIFAVAKAWAMNPSACKWCSSEIDQVPRLMKQYLVQLALGDEWYRVFLVEKRVGLGIVVISAYFLGLVNLIASTTAVNGLAASLMIPSLVAVIVSGWMNVVIFVTRLDLNKKEAAAKALRKRKKAAIGTFKLGDSYYN